VKPAGSHNSKQGTLTQKPEAAVESLDRAFAAAQEKDAASKQQQAKQSEQEQ
jgi:hypothetical protein